jgi:hypothetical protein
MVIEATIGEAEKIGVTGKHPAQLFERERQMRLVFRAAKSRVDRRRYVNSAQP